jgi:hypothetical protein
MKLGGYGVLVLWGCGGTPDSPDSEDSVELPGLVDLPSIVQEDLRGLFVDMAVVGVAVAEMRESPAELNSSGPGNCAWTWSLAGDRAAGSWSGAVAPSPCGGAFGVLDYEIREAAMVGTWSAASSTPTIEATGSRTGTVIRDDRAADVSWLIRELSLEVREGAVRGGYLRIRWLGYGGGNSDLELGVSDGMLLGVIRGVGPVCEVAGSVGAPRVTCGE